MSSIASNLQAAESNLTNAQSELTNIATGVSGLDTLILNLEAAATSGGDQLSPATQALLTQVVNTSAALNQQAQAINTAAPVPPTPPAPPSGS